MIFGRQPQIQVGGIKMTTQVSQKLIDVCFSQLPSVAQFFNWASSVLQSFHSGFTDNLCSLRTQMEDGIPKQITDASGN